MRACLSTRRISVPFSVATVFLLLVSVRAPAQSSDAQAGRLAAVHISGSRFASALIVPATGLKPGDMVTKDDLQQGADRLAALGPFSKVQYRYSSSTDGVRVDYEVTDGPGIPVWFDNFPGFTDEQIIASLKMSVGLFDGTAPAVGTLLDDISRALQQLLLTRGVVASVTHSRAVEPDIGEQVQLFHVDNISLKIASVEFTDALAQNDHGIQARLADLTGHPFSRSTVELFEFEQVRPVYISHGFLRVRFGSPTTSLVGNTASPDVAVKAPIEPGPAFAWNGVAWTGNSAVPSRELNGLVNLKPGDLVDGMKLEALWQSVSDAYTRRGYLDVNVTETPQFDDAAGRVSYAVAITEGPQYRMGKLVLTGLSVEGESRIRTAWKIFPGAIFDKSVFEDFSSDGIKEALTGLPFHYEKLGRLLQTNTQTGTVDVLFDFQ
jgi:outer membrane protein assembly factor BamA